MNLDPLPHHWYLLRSEAANGVHNMAVDAALLAYARSTSAGVWRCYAWERPTVSFGRHEAVRGRFDQDSIVAAGLDVARRPTGGRALLHSREVTYSVTLPLADNASWRQAYAAINRILLDALISLGVDAMLVPASVAAPTRPDGPLCFDVPTPGEIVVHGAKLVGSAVWRARGAYLQHGSILLHDDQAMLVGAAHAPIVAPPPAAALAACCPVAPTWLAVADALESALASRYAVQPFVTPTLLASSIDAHERDLTRPEWIWRR